MPRGGGDTRSRAARKRALRILVFEFATSGGVGGASRDARLIADLWREGETMRRLLSEDLTHAGHEVRSLLAPSHPRPPPVPPPVPPAGSAPLGSPPDHSEPVNEQEQWLGLQRLRDAVRDVEATVLIAPECQGLLARLAEEITRWGGQLLSPDPQFIEWAADKQQLADRLSAAGIPVPPGRRVAPGEAADWDQPLPWVLKPLDGAGSMEISRLDAPPREPVTSPRRLERYCPGIAVSVAALGGPRGWVLLEPCRQHLRDSLHFQYMGGSLPLPSKLARRALQLARHALQILPQTQGYVGLDLVLGSADDGETDYVIEVNPRLTTSYTGLRVAAQGNLAGWMVEVAQGKSPRIHFSPRPLEFRIDGSVTCSTPFFQPSEPDVHPARESLP
jgi:tyramine---L-glutamate ligase